MPNLPVGTRGRLKRGVIGLLERNLSPATIPINSPLAYSTSRAKPSGN
jgi:hypothetical protein